MKLSILTATIGVVVSSVAFASGTSPAPWIEVVTGSFYCNVASNPILDACSDGVFIAGLTKDLDSITFFPATSSEFRPTTSTPDDQGYTLGRKDFVLSNGAGNRYSSYMTAYNFENDSFLFDPQNGSEYPYLGIFDGAALIFNARSLDLVSEPPLRFVLQIPPVPEPSVQVLFLAGAFLFGIGRQLRTKRTVYVEA